MPHIGGGDGCMGVLVLYCTPTGSSSKAQYKGFLSALPSIKRCGVFGSKGCDHFSAHAFFPKRTNGRRRSSRRLPRCSTTVEKGVWEISCRKHSKNDTYPGSSVLLLLILAATPLSREKDESVDNHLHSPHLFSSYAKT